MNKQKNLDFEDILNRRKKELAEISGIHAGDGYLRNKDYRREWDISGSIDEKGYYDNHIIPLFNRIFNLNIKGRFFPHRNTYGFVLRDRKIIEFAHDILGFPYGAKSLVVKVPQFVIQNSPLIPHFLRGYFDTDGCFSCGKKYGKYCEFKRTFHFYPRVVLTTVSKYLSRDIAKLLNLIEADFCFHTYQPRRKTESLKYRYEINGNIRVPSFIKLIKPKNNTKMSRFLIWQKFGICPTNITFQQRKDILLGKIDPFIFYKGPVV